MANSDDDWLDGLLLEDDRSTRGWKRRAVGMSTHEAARRVPVYGQITCKVPIAQWRVVSAHCRRQGVSLGMFLRHAVAAKLVAEGVNPDLIPDLIRGKRERRRPRSVQTVDPGSPGEGADGVEGTNRP